MKTMQRSYFVTNVAKNINILKPLEDILEQSMQQTEVLNIGIVGSVTYNFKGKTNITYIMKL
jgi:hypothetical protein